MYVYIYIHIYHDSRKWGGAGRLSPSQMITVRSVFKMSCLFLRPRPWQFEIRDSTGK